jgi:hypothetical protein
VLIQQSWRLRVCDWNKRKQEVASVVLQMAIRGFVARRRFRVLVERRDIKRVSDMKSRAAVVLQGAWASRVAALEEKRRVSVLVIQALCRGHRCRMWYQEIVATKKRVAREAEEWLRLQNQVSGTIQLAWRKYNARRKQRMEERKQKENTHKIIEVQKQNKKHQQQKREVDCFTQAVHKLAKQLAFFFAPENLQVDRNLIQSMLPDGTVPYQTLLSFPTVSQYTCITKNPVAMIQDAASMVEYIIITLDGLRYTNMVVPQQIPVVPIMTQQQHGLLMQHAFLMQQQQQIMQQFQQSFYQ